MAEQSGCYDDLHSTGHCESMFEGPGVYLLVRNLASQAAACVTHGIPIAQPHPNGSTATCVHVVGCWQKATP